MGFSKCDDRGKNGARRLREEAPPGERRPASCGNGSRLARFGRSGGEHVLRLAATARLLRNRTNHPKSLPQSHSQSSAGKEKGNAGISRGHTPRGESREIRRDSVRWQPCQMVNWSILLGSAQVHEFLLCLQWGCMFCFIVQSPEIEIPIYKYFFYFCASHFMTCFI